MKKIFLILFSLAFFFTGFAQNADIASATGLVTKHSTEIGLTKDGLENYLVSSTYKTEGMQMVYLIQSYKGLPVRNQMKVLAFRDDRVISNMGTFIENVASLATSQSITPALTPGDAVRAAFSEQKLSVPALGSMLVSGGQEFDYGKIAGVTENVTGKLTWVPVEEHGKIKSVNLVWEVVVAPKTSDDVWHVMVDANTGKVIEKVNFNISDNWDIKSAKNPLALQNLRGHSEDKTFQHTLSANSPSSVAGAGYLVIPYPAESPIHPGGTAAVRNNPWTNAPGNASTLGWHSNGTTDYTITRGNNAWSTEDQAATNTNSGLPATSTTGPDPLTFNFPPDYTQDPRTTAFQKFAITNQFYWVNTVHDMTYQYGFNEVSGNYQNNNQGRGGNGGDDIIALAQSGAAGPIGNNANFLPTVDGTRGRMRMYLFNAVPTLLTVNTPSSISGNYTAVEGAVSTANLLINVGPVTAPVVYFDDNNHEACSGVSATSLTGKIALIRRGNCNFTDKILAAQNAGAVGVIMINNVSGALVIMSGADNNIHIPAVFVSDITGALFVGELGNNLNATLKNDAGVVLDGDLDNGVISHELTHGISNRLTGGPATASCLNNAEEGGEGWSDYVGLMMTTNWATASLTDGPLARPVGNYVTGQSASAGVGIRNYPYSTDFFVNPLSYARMGTANAANPASDPNFTEVHDIGEIWCAAVWEMTWNIIQQQGAINPNLFNFSSTTTGGNSIALKLVLEGLRLQPCSPGFIDARNAILAADRSLYCGSHACAIWTAFAKRGMGYGASQGSSNNATDQTATFTLPPAPTVTAQPVDVSVASGANATFTANAGADVNLIYQWQVSTDGGTTWTDISCSIASTLTLTAVTPSMSGYKYRAKVYIGCLSTNTAVATLTVTGAPVPAITLTSATGTSNQTVCVNTAITNIVYTTSGGVTGATVTGLPAGVTGTYAANVFTISGTPTATGTFNYTVTSTGVTPAVTATGTITVNAATTLTLTSAPATNNQTVTLTNAITGITYSTGGGVTGVTVTGLPGGVTGTYSGGTNGTFTISGTPTAAGTFNYTVTTSGGCGVQTATGTINVVNGPSITLSSATGTSNQTVCVNTAITGITYSTAGGVTGATVTGLPTGVTGTYAAGVFTISGTPTVTGTFNYTITTSGGTPAATATGTITVNGASTLTLTSAPATTTQTVNINTAITNITYSTTGGITGATVTGLPAGVTGTYSGGTNGTITISGTPTAAGVFNYTVTTSGGCGVQTKTGTITVVTPPSITISSAAGTSSQSVCTGNAITPITYTTAGGVTGATVTGLPAGVTGAYSGGTNGTYTISGTPTATGVFNYTVTTSGGASTATTTGTITVTAIPAAPGVAAIAYCQGVTAVPLTATGTNLLWYTAAAGGTGSTTAPTPSTTAAGTTSYYVSQTTGCEGPRAQIVVTVNPTPGVPTVTSPVNYCVGITAVPLTATGTNLKWYTAVTGGTGSTTAPTPSTATPGSVTYYVSQTTGTCEGPRAAIVVNTNVGAVITTQPTSITSCATTATFTVVATGTGLTYQWQVSTDGGITYTNIPGATSSTVVINGLTAAMANYRYRVVVTAASCGSVTSNYATAQVGTPPVVILTAAPSTVYNPSLNGGLFTTVSPVGNYTYQWKRDNAILPTTDPFIIASNGLLYDFGTYQVTVTDAATGCAGLSNLVTIVDDPNGRDRLYVSPNPTPGPVRVSYYSSSTAVQARMLTVYDEKGSRVMTKNFNVSGRYGYTDIDLSKWVSGTYLIVLMDASGKQVASERVVKY